jgi:hypothetical protein
MWSAMWRVFPPAVFVLVTGLIVSDAILHPWTVGSHGVIYTSAARAALTGGDPWVVGPPGGIFAGPPTMLLPFEVLTPLPDALIRVASVATAALLAMLSLRRLGLPAYWIAFPPLSAAIVLGHPEPLVLWLLLVRSPLASAVAPLIKPYSILPLIASGRWKAVMLAGVGLVLTAPILPWATFLREAPTIQATLARQTVGDSTFGDPLAMAVAFVSLLLLGWRRALWLATPLLLPYAQRGYKVGAIPALSPLMAVAWAIPIHGMTVAGVAIEAGCLVLARFDRLPKALAPGLMRPEASLAVVDHPWIAWPTTNPARAR